MQELTLVGVHEDGEHLVLDGPDGQRFLLRVDEALRVAVRRDRARLGQLQIQMDGKLRPREIQARIRAGQTAEEVAEAAGVPVEHVRRYEGPVLAEREFVVRQARAVRVRRPGAGMVSSASAPTLEELVHQRLAAREVDESAAAWDAWRSEDGTWVVSLSFAAAGRDRQARWAYDVQLRHVAPMEDEARWLTDDEPAEAGGSQRRLAPVRGGRAGPVREREGRREPAAEPAPARDGVHDRVYDVEADGGVRTVEEERSLPPAAAATAATVDLLDTLRERRGRRQRITLPDDDGPQGPDSPGGQADPLDAALDGLRARAEALGDPPAAHPPRSRPELAQDAELLVLPDTDPRPVPVSAPAGRDGGARGGGTPEGEGGQGRLPSRRSRRASVPSWDDIVFGSRRE